MHFPHRREEEQIEVLQEEVDVLAEAVVDLIEDQPPGPCVAVTITFTPKALKGQAA